MFRRFWVKKNKNLFLPSTPKIDLVIPHIFVRFALSYGLGDTGDFVFRRFWVKKTKNLFLPSTPEIELVIPNFRPFRSISYG